MKTHHVIGSVAGLLALFALPALALASGSASVGALSPGDTVGADTHVTFSIIPSGFTNPAYWVVDSFGGGVNNSNIDNFGNISWTPNNSDIGSHTITVTVSDSQGDSATASQTITVTAPSITIGSVSPGTSVMYGTPITFTLGSIGFLSPQYSVADSFGYSSITSGNTDSSGNFHWTPLYQDIGTHTIVATARDYLGHLATVSQQMVVTGPTSVTVGPVTPGTPVHVGESVSFAATTTGFTAPSFTIKDAFTSTLGTSSLAIDQTGKATWTPAPNDIGVHAITVSASDSSGKAGSALVTISVVPGSTGVSQAGTGANRITIGVQAKPPAQEAYVFKNYLSVGSSGKDVLALQQLLAQLGLFSQSPTGYFGAVTKRAVQSYQSAHGIDALGVVGPATRASLNTGR